MLQSQVAPDLDESAQDDNVTQLARTGLLQYLVRLVTAQAIRTNQSEAGAGAKQTGTVAAATESHSPGCRRTTRQLVLLVTTYLTASGIYTTTCRLEPPTKHVR